MKLMTKAIEKRLLANTAATFDNPDRNTYDDKAVKFFTMGGAAAWFVTEGEKVDGDWRLFGFADLGDRDCAELGYTMLSDLESLTGFRTVERDLYFDKTLGEVLASYGRRTERLAA